MIETINLNIKTEPEILQRIETLFSQFGITVSDAVNIFFHQSLMQGGLPFTVHIPEYNKETFEAMDDVNSNRNLSPAFDNMKDLMDSLYA